MSSNFDSFKEARFGFALGVGGQGLWQQRIGVAVGSWGIKRMKTRWGTCNQRAGRIWLNSELIKKPVACIEYVVVHEMLHLVEPTHSDRFIALMNKHYPAWREARAELNELPLAAAVWKE